METIKQLLIDVKNCLQHECADIDVMKRLDAAIEQASHPAKIEKRIVRNAGNSYDHSDNYMEGYDEGWNDCLAAIEYATKQGI